MEQIYTGKAAALDRTSTSSSLSIRLAAVIHVAAQHAQPRAAWQFSARAHSVMTFEHSIS